MCGHLLKDLGDLYLCPSLPKSLDTLDPARCRWTVVLRDVIPLHSPVCSPSAPYFPINEIEMVVL